MGQTGQVTSTPSPRFGLRRNLLRPEGRERSDRVTFVELFFDLIFVFALTQLSRFLSENQSLLGIVESTILVLALWWVWIYTTWVTNWLDPAQLPVRGVVIVLALIGLVMSTSIYDSFADRGLVFAIAYVVLQLGRTVFMIAAVARHDRQLALDFTKVLVWLVAASAFWVVGAVLPLEYRVPLWIAAIVIEYLSAAVGFRVPGFARSRVGDWDISGEHIAERSALFVIIAIGESFLVTGFAFVDQEASLQGVIGVLLAFVGGVVMWWLYFDRTQSVGATAIAASEHPGQLARFAYTYVHVVIIGGIVLTSVADKEILLHPEDAIKVSTALTVVGGPALYLAGLALFRWVIAREVLISHLAGLGMLLAAVLASTLVSPLGLGALATGVLVVVAGWETTRRVRAGEQEADVEAAER